MAKVVVQCPEGDRAMIHSGASAQERIYMGHWLRVISGGAGMASVIGLRRILGGPDSIKSIEGQLLTLDKL